MSLGAKKVNASAGGAHGSLAGSKLGTTAKGVLSKAVLGKQAAASKNSAKAVAKPVAPVAKPNLARPAGKEHSAQKLAVSSRAALVNKPNGASAANGKPAVKSVNKPVQGNKPMNVMPIAKPAPAPIDPRFEPFRLLLLAKRDELRGSLGDTRFGAQGQNGRVAEEDQAAVSHEEFISSKRNSMEFRMLRLVNAALDRIQRGEYGICHACEEDISEKRLKAIPWAEFCVQCQDSHGNVDNDVSEAATPAGAAPALQVWNW
jgi:DnaK suppressor protein